MQVGRGGEKVGTETITGSDYIKNCEMCSIWGSPNGTDLTVVYVF
jgi:hypothetical protein